MMDIHLGDMNGYEATRSIREFLGHHDTRVIAMTALLEKYVKDKLPEAGIDGAFYKPLTKPKFIQLFKQENIHNGKEK